MKKNVLDFTPSRNTIVGRILCNDPDSYEPEIVSLIKFFIHQSKKPLFIDVGSNIGLFPLNSIKICF